MNALDDALKFPEMGKFSAMEFLLTQMERINEMISKQQYRKSTGVELFLKGNT